MSCTKSRMNPIENKLKLIAGLKRETVHASGVIIVNNNGTYVWQFSNAKKIIRDTNFESLLDKVISFILNNRVEIPDKLSEPYLEDDKYHRLQKYKLLNLDYNERKQRLKIT